MNQSTGTRSNWLSPERGGSSVRSQDCPLCVAYCKFLFGQDKQNEVLEKYSVILISGLVNNDLSQ